MLISDNGYFVLHARHLKLNRLGIYQFHRRIPEDLQHHYDGKSHIQRSLGTRDPAEAAKAAVALARSQDALWSTLRTPGARERGLVPADTRAAAMSLIEHLGYSPGDRRKPDYDSDAIDQYLEARKGPEYLEARHGDTWPPVDPGTFLNATEREVVRQLNVDPSKPTRLLSDCLARYLSDHENGTDPLFVQSTSRSVNIVVETIGDLPLEAITRDHARAVLEALVASGKATTTVQRQLTTVKAVINHCIHEWGLECKNHFEKLKIKGLGHDVKPRYPFTHEELVTIAQEARRRDTDVWWMIGLQMDLGTRIEEVTGLRVDDIKLDAPVPHVHIRPHLAIGHRLKNQGSERIVPLVGMALWGAQRALRHPSYTGWVFPRYASDGQVMANSASKTVNLWLKKTSGTGKTSHGFRHSMKDRLRDAEVSEQMQLQIMGHASKGAAGGYGRGFSLEKLKEALGRIVLG
jgi:integrase